MAFPEIELRVLGLLEDVRCLCIFPVNKNIPQLLSLFKDSKGWACNGTGQLLKHPTCIPSDTWDLCVSKWVM